VTAVTAALNAFSRELLAEHIRTCVTRDLKEGNEETVEELVETVRKMMR
jgi:DNA-binding FrmR family transcriptional regulator